MTAWSKQQSDFLEWVERGKGSCVLEAVAGAGKTTTIIEAAIRINTRVAMVAFNKKIADEIKTKLEKRNIDWKRVQAGTVHSFGFSAYRKFKAYVQVDNRKTKNLFDDMDFNEDQKAYSSSIIKLVSLAKLGGFGVKGTGTPTIDDFSDWIGVNDHHDVLTFDDRKTEKHVMREIVVPACVRLLRESNRTLDVIDFDDMIYLPLLLDLSFFKYDAVFVDEAQDTNVTRRLIVAKMLSPRGRMIAVGDRHQAIYGFTGADSDALDNIRRHFKCVDFPLTTTYRCPKSVVKFARTWVNHIEAHASAPEGSVEVSDLTALLNTDRNETSAVLCRNTAPLVRTALWLISNKVPCAVEGRDLGAGILKFVRSMKARDTTQLDDKMTKHLDERRPELIQKGQEKRLDLLEDTIAAVRVMIEAQLVDKSLTRSQAISVVQLECTITKLFADDVKTAIALSTIHRSKGREWKEVFWLNRSTTIPSPYAKLPWQRQQETNLCYVAATRAMHRLVEISA